MWRIMITYVLVLWCSSSCSVLHSIKTLGFEVSELADGRSDVSSNGGTDGAHLGSGCGPPSHDKAMKAK